MSRLHRLRLADRVPSPARQVTGERKSNRFFVTVNLRRALAPLADKEYECVAAAMEESRRKLGFLLLGYILVPDHWHALISPAFPLTISRVVQDVKWIFPR